MTTSFRPPAHEHSLIPRELSENYSVQCRRCGCPIHGRTNCCLDCNVFFHKWCTEWPLQIQHPCHPQHPLILVTDNYFKSSYCCHECRFSDRAEDLVSTLPPTGEQAEEDETVDHFAHEHPLASFSVTTPNNIRCGACRQEISGRVYGCLSVDSTLMCIVRFQLCLQKDQQNKVSSMVDHFSHPHPLRSFNIKEENKHLTCKACEQHASGDVYGCPGCMFFLHRSCAELDGEMFHFHHDHNLILSAEGLHNDGSFICNCCLEASSGFVYNCERCDFNLDTECALKTRSALYEGISARVQHFAHQHILTLHYLKGYNCPECNACKQPARGLAYCCLSCDRFSLHLSCFQLPLKLEHEFHPSQPLTLRKMASDSYAACNACRRKCTGFAFQCEECKLHMDVECASLKPTLKHLRHEHTLAYFKRAMGLHCNACGSSSNADLYRCVSCDFNLHHDCIPLPLTARSEFHIHPLFLKEKFISGYGDSGEEYCDVCEEMRNPDLGVYCCQECRFAAHIECVISTVSLDREKLVKNTQWSIVDEEIASAKEEMEAMKTQLEALMKKRTDMDSQTVRGV
ncbi:hypothetical protein CRG98_030442 [Punica granatum]|uniref:Zinc finger PHD-type domain-containing protein n=1 Tax=Punica granatum TaxID=22663 RepID=A0A2I0IYV6_PUNGR|nr:hypothetical protein CRG98_030442 [Punica granatum]